MFRLLKNLLGGVLAFLGQLLSFGKKSPDPMLEAGSSPQEASKPVPPRDRPSQQKTFFLEGDEARSFQSPDRSATKPAAQTDSAQPERTAAQTLNLPAPKVTPYRQAATPSDRRRPGANMQGFLEMARQIKPAR